MEIRWSQIHTGNTGEIVTWSKTFEAEQPWFYQSLTLATWPLRGCLSEGEEGEKSEKIAAMKGGRFHIKAFLVISALKNTEVEDFRRFTMDARACVEW